MKKRIILITIIGVLLISSLIAGAETAEHVIHQMISHPRIDPTPISEGVEAYWECTECHKYFSDAEGKNEIEAPIKIPIDDTVTAGICGNNLTWSYSKGTLTISGTGNMYNYSDDNIESLPPWFMINGVSLNIIALEIDAGVTSIGDFAFYSLNLQQVTIPDNITSIGVSAFEKNDLISIIIPKSVVSIGKYAIRNHSGRTTIYGFSGSTAQNYATTYNIPFVALHQKHSMIEFNKIDATCTTPGTEAYWQCPFCGRLFSDSEGKNEIKAPRIINALGHTEVIDEAKAATCTETGLTEGKHCSICNEIFVAQKEISALGHDWDEGKVTNGVQTFTCKRCGETKTEEINKKVHIGKTGWVENSDGTWSYGDKNGDVGVGPMIINRVMYCFNEQGKMITGWALVGGKWYYAESSGAVYHSGWTQVGSTWYYFRANGEMAVGWLYDGGIYYYINKDGTMATGWIEDHSEWYYLSPKSGALYTGWMKDGNSWYLLKPSGALAMDCWYNDGGTWYYFLGSGAMATGWQEIDGQWEMFDQNGLWQYTWDGQ